MRRTPHTRLAALVTACALLAVPTAASAQSAAAPPAPAGAPSATAPATAAAPAAATAPATTTPATATAPTTAPAAPATTDAEPASPVERAKLHYDRGMKLYGEENFEAALTEFERAYEFAPNYKILYSLALIQRHQNNYAAALANFQRYLREGGAALPEERRTEVEREIAVLRPRCASLEIKSNVDGADVFIDDAPACASGSLGTCIGKTPIAGAIIVNPGRRKIIATKPGYSTATSIVTLVGLDALTVKLELTSLARPERKVDVKPRNRAIVAWSVTGGLAVGAVITGVFALNAQSKLKSDVKSVNADPGVLDHDSSHVKSLSLVADIFTGTAVAAGLVSTYFTYKALRANPDADAPREKPGPVGFDVGPTGARVFGQF